MRKFAKVLIPALLLVAIVVSCSMMFASAAVENPIYIANESTGDGSGKDLDNLMGHDKYTGTVTHVVSGNTTNKSFTDASYGEVSAYVYSFNNGELTFTNELYKKNVFYKAFNALSGEGGTIILTEEINFDIAVKMTNQSVVDVILPASSKQVTITSIGEDKNGNPVDFRTSGAKLILDHSKWNSGLIEFRTPTTWKDLDIEYRYSAKENIQQVSWEKGFGLYSCGENFTVETGVNVISTLVADDGTPSVGDRYPYIVAGRRYAAVGKSPVITIKSGSWETILAAGHGLNSGNPGTVTGDVAVNISGGTVKTLNGGGSTASGRAYSKISGNLAINVTGGTVTTLTAATGAGVTGNVDINVTNPGKVGTIIHNSTGATAGAVNVRYDTGSVDMINNPSSFDLVDPPFENTTPIIPTGKVVYVASNGKGDGSSPDNPIGNADGYRPGGDDTATDDNNRKNAFYRAADLLKSTGGIIVVVDDVYLDTATSRNTTTYSQTPGEMRWPNINGSVLITSVYGGVDYAAKNGAELVLDYATSHSTNLPFTSNTTIENIDILYKYKSALVNNWDTTFMFYANGYELVIGENVDVSSFDVSQNAEGDRYPTILGGHRYSNISGRNPVVTINSGKWETVIAGCYGNSASAPGIINGNSTIIINGGTVERIYGTGSEKRSTGTITGDVKITINGGEVDRLYFSNNKEFTGTGTVTLGANAKIAFADYATSKYEGDLANLKTRVTFVNNTDLVIGKEPVREPEVVYIAANGTGDGSSPDKPLGTIADYKVDNKSYVHTAFYKAVEKLRKYGGYIVVVGDVAIDSAESRVDGIDRAPAELPLPQLGGKLVVTSVYKGVDYRANAKLILDQDACAVTFLTFKSDVTFENINIEHKYNSSDKNNWGLPMVIAANGNELVIGENVNVTAWNVETNQEGDWYPGIIGGHRYSPVNGDTNVTIKSGTWSVVNAGSFGMTDANPGAVSGSATLNIEGGKIETVYGTSSTAKPTASIAGKLTINVTGGTIEAIYATAKNGAKNEIEVNIARTAERVAKVWGGTSDSNIPANMTLTYDRSVTRDDEIKYVAADKITAKGDVSEQPAPIYYVLYVANVSRGKGDGSSPENAIGHAPGYAEARAKGLAIIKANGGTNTGLASEVMATFNTVYKMNALYRALSYNGNKMVSQGGYIVVCDVLTVDVTDAMRDSLADFFAPVGAGTVTITSLYDGVDYRWKGAKLVLDSSELGLCLELGSPTVFDHLTIEHKYNSKRGKTVDYGAVIAARGNKLTIGYDVYSFATDVNPDEESRVEMYPSICGGHRYSNSKTDNYVTVGSGNWAMVVGGAWGGAHTGNATIGINGGKIGTVCGTTKATSSNKAHVLDGSVWIGLWGGEVDNVYVVAKPGIKWGDASVGIGNTVVNGRIRATHPDYEGEDVQAWAFYYTDSRAYRNKVFGFETVSPETGSPLVYLAVVAVVSLAGVGLLISKKRKAVK